MIIIIIIKIIVIIIIIIIIIVIIILVIIIIIIIVVDRALFQLSMILCGAAIYWAFWLVLVSATHNRGHCVSQIAHG